MRALPALSSLHPVASRPAPRPTGRKAAPRAMGAPAPPGAPPPPPFILGLTGGIGMGKSAVAAMLRARGVPVLDADAVVHALYAPGGAAAPLVGAAFPGAVAAPGAGVDRAALGAAVLGRPEALARLEAIVHPLVAAERVRFVAAAAARGDPLVVLEVPLLFETGAERDCDAVAAVSAPAAAQRARALARPGMGEAKLAAVLGRQLGDAERRARADHVIDTGCAEAETEAAVAALAAKLAAAPRAAYARLLADRVDTK
jgi:dephospho-CoA kinase